MDLVGTAAEKGFFWDDSIYGAAYASSSSRRFEIYNDVASKVVRHAMKFAIVTCRIIALVKHRTLFD
ncbi:hypothetical protein [Anaplasma phagocytophilum]|uniref:hypothetical protein n=1 Tax=Anaplasma phagocytophilum TaxID=948 RepID=UPI000762C6B7|nr:hypothetical protein [Anaplasma phagocytophilum]